MSKVTEMKRYDLIERARRYWDHLADFRRERERCKRYSFGDQWGDRVSVDGRSVTEGDIIRAEGSTPLKNNLINRFLRNVMGVYRSQSKEPSCVARDESEIDLANVMSTVMQCNWQLNKMSEVLAVVMKEFLISGAAIVRKSWGTRCGHTDCWTDIVDPRNFFVDDAMRDIRGWDVTTVGEIKEMSFPDLVAEFAESPRKIDRLRALYPPAGGPGSARQFGGADGGTNDFLRPSDPSMCRVVEAWTRERMPRYLCHDRRDGQLYKIEASDLERVVTEENRRRRRDSEPLIEAVWTLDEVWVYRYLAPDGTVLREAVSPYAHGTHPYVFKFHPFIDGEVHSFVSDIIDQQRYVNRLITLYDWMIRASAKGVLLFPQECLPQGWTYDDVAREWTRFNGVLPIRGRTGEMLPRQVSGNVANAGLNELINLQLKFFEDISGVNGALQGKPGFAGMSASLYSQQTQNSAMSLLDILEAFSDFVIDGAYKDLKNIRQYYDASRICAISGRHDTFDRLARAEFDIAIAETPAVPAFRMKAEPSEPSENSDKN